MKNTVREKLLSQGQADPTKKLRRFRDSKTAELFMQMYDMKPMEVGDNLGMLVDWMQETENRLSKCLLHMYNDGRGMSLGDISEMTDMTEAEVDELLDDCPEVEDDQEEEEEDDSEEDDDDSEEKMEEDDDNSDEDDEDDDDSEEENESEKLGPPAYRVFFKEGMAKFRTEAAQLKKQEQGEKQSAKRNTAMAIPLAVRHWKGLSVNEKSRRQKKATKGN